MKASEYTNNLINALMINFENTSELYNYDIGCRRLAKEYGVGLRDFKFDERIIEIEESYYNVCVRFFQLYPPIEYNEWTSIVYQSSIV